MGARSLLGKRNLVDRRDRLLKRSENLRGVEAGEINKPVQETKPKKRRNEARDNRTAGEEATEMLPVLR